MRTMKFGVWCGLLFQLPMFLGWFTVGGLFPLHLPSANADVIAAFYAENAVSVKMGCVIIWFALIPFSFFIGTLSAFIRKVQHEASDMLANVQIIGGCANLMLVAFPTIFWIAIAFRPERAPDIIHALNDFAWLAIIAPFWPTCIQMLCVGIAALVDKTAAPVFPRWYGYVALWVAFLSLPGSLVPFFYGGPFAWNGILGFWLPASVFGIFVISTTYAFLQVLKNEERIELAGAAA